MGLAIVNGLLTSIILETIILIRQMNLKQAINTALGMSFISMIGMELAMNITDLFFTGGAILYMVGNSNYVNYWLYSTSIQLLEIKKSTI